MPLLESLKVQLLWKLVLPLLVAWKGYIPWSLLGMGDDLPLGVYEQWKKWCAYPRYFFDDPEQSGLIENYAQVRTPIVAATALDDPWAPPLSRDAFMQGYKNAPLQCIDLDTDKAMGSIGHMGYFRQEAEPLWDNVLAWFDLLNTSDSARPHPCRALRQELSGPD